MATAPASSPRTFRRRLLDYVAIQGTWVPHRELVKRGPHADEAIDALFDLVNAGVIEHQDRTGYRLAGGPLVREAARKLLQSPELSRVVEGQQIGLQFFLGIAERRRDLASPDNPDGVVTYAIDIPTAANAAAALDQAQRLAVFQSLHA